MRRIDFLHHASAIIPNMNGYHLRMAETLALRHIQTRTGLRVVILEGPPGVGKTYFAECLAGEIGAGYEYYQCHNWTTDEDLFVGVHVGRVAAGVERPADSYEYGVLARALFASQEGPVVLCVDELDKSPQRAEALLLDFLQHGRVFGPCREQWQANLTNLTVIITTNGVRPLMEATLRRGFRVQMGFLPPDVEADLVRKAAGLPSGANRAIVRMATVIRQKGATKPSLQEMCRLAGDLKSGVAEKAADVEMLILGWLCKQPEDMAVLTAEFKNFAAVLWGEIKR